jgi:hypothetical protein
MKRQMRSHGPLRGDNFVCRRLSARLLRRGRLGLRPDRECWRRGGRFVCPGRAKLGFRSALLLCKLCDQARSSGGTGRGDGFVVIFPELGTGWLRNMKRLVEIFAGHF